RHLLGGEQRELHDVVADAAGRGPGLRLDLLLGVAQHPLALALCVVDDLRLEALALLAALLAQAVCLLARLGEADLVVVEELGGLLAAPLGLLDARRDVAAALLD